MLRRSRACRRWAARLTATLWGACFCAGVGAGLLLAAPDEAATPAPAAALARAAALERAFGAPCTSPPPAPALAVIAPLDEQATRFLAARCRAAAGELEPAGKAFREGLAQEPIAPALWRWQLLQALALQGDLEASLRELEALLQGIASSALLERVRGLVAEQVLEPGRAPLERHRELLVAYLEHVTPQPEDYDLLLRLWELTGAREHPAQRGALGVLLWRNPKDEAAAARWAPVRKSGEPAGGGAPTGADTYGRAERLFKLGLFERLADELERSDLSALEDTYAKALGRLYFRALIRADHLQRAAVQVSTGSVMRRFGFDRRQQLVWGIRIQLRRRMIGPVLKFLEELEVLSPRDEELPAIYFELLKYNQGRGNTVTMLHWLERIASEYPRSVEASDAYWQVIWATIARRAYAEALPLLEAAIRHSASFHPVDRARLYYWRGRVQMRQGDAAGGEASWREMEAQWPYGYYSVLAERMRSGDPLILQSARNGHPPEPAPEPTLKALWSIEPFPRALFLFAVGEPDLAQEALKDALARRLSPEALEEASRLFSFLERHALQLRLMANHNLEIMRTSRVEGSPLWHRAFPRPHWELVLRMAEEHQIDPYFVLAIMREESRFFASAHSRAGAKGLMQLMPSTARMIAKRNGMAFDEARLHTPEFNIPLGTLYLKRVLERFEGNPVYAAAAYNAGPGNVNRWLRRTRTLPLDEFVERIPFGETQRYVKRVFLSYLVYTKLYR